MMQCLSRINSDMETLIVKLDSIESLMNRHFTDMKNHIIELQSDLDSLKEASAVFNDAVKDGTLRNLETYKQWVVEVGDSISYIDIFRKYLVIWIFPAINQVQPSLAL